jgi:hypothetical protein
MILGLHRQLFLPIFLMVYSSAIILYENPLTCVYTPIHVDKAVGIIVGQSRGLFIVTPKAAAEYGNHAIGVDLARKLVYDSVGNYAMESFNRCVNGSCTGFHDILELVRCPTTRKKRKRGGK